MPERPQKAPSILLFVRFYGASIYIILPADYNSCKDATCKKRKRGDWMKKAGLAVLFLALLLAACGGGLSEEQTALLPYVSSIGDIEIPEGVRVVSLGESSHGAQEYHTMRREVFAELMQKYGCRTFLLEAGFGACLKVNDYILGKTPEVTAREALQALESWVYQTAEFEDLLQWMHDYNQTAPETQKIHFYGVDMRESACAKAHLLSYVQQTAPDRAAAYTEMLAPLKNSSYEYPDEELTQARQAPVARALELIAAELDAHAEQYRTKSGAHAFSIARECVTVLQEYVLSLPMQQTGIEEDIPRLAASCEQRDVFMANRVETILRIEGAQMVFLTGHNMHVARRTEQSNGVPQVRTMGSELSDRLRDGYFAIGTAFCKGRITAIHYELNGLRNFSLKETHPFIRLFADLPGDSWYVELPRVAADERLAPYLTQSHTFLDTGAVYSKAIDSKESPVSPRHPAVLGDSWDAMLIFKQTHPTQILSSLKAEEDT